MRAELKFQEVNGVSREDIPNSDEDILTDFNFPLEAIAGIDIYFRRPEDCPNGRGNWVIDVHFIDKPLFYIKLPKEMTEEQVARFVKPLFDKLKARKNH